MLKGLFEGCFPSWLRILKEKINACKPALFENNIHFDPIIALFSIACEDTKNAEKAI